MVWVGAPGTDIDNGAITNVGVVYGLPQGVAASAGKVHAFTFSVEQHGTEAQFNYTFAYSIQSTLECVDKQAGACRLRGADQTRTSAMRSRCTTTLLLLAPGPTSQVGMPIIEDYQNMGGAFVFSVNATLASSLPSYFRVAGERMSSCWAATVLGSLLA